MLLIVGQSKVVQRDDYEKDYLVSGHASPSLHKESFRLHRPQKNGFAAILKRYVFQEFEQSTEVLLSDT